MAAATGSNGGAMADAGGAAPALMEPDVCTVADLMSWKNGVTVVARVLSAPKEVQRSSLRAPMGARDLLPPGGAAPSRSHWFAVVADGTAAISAVLVTGESAPEFKQGGLVVIRNSQPILAATSAVAASRAAAPRLDAIALPDPFARLASGLRRFHCPALLVHEPWTQVTALDSAAASADMGAAISAAAAAVPTLEALLPEGGPLAVPDITAASEFPFPSWAEEGGSGARSARRDAPVQAAPHSGAGSFRGGRRDGASSGHGNGGGFRGGRRGHGSSGHRVAPSHADHGSAAPAAAPWAPDGPVATPSLAPDSGAAPSPRLGGYASAASRAQPSGRE
ncbi:hypothetical protein FNF27_03884 [Cafeteria roenbergensis]|uniref:Uncharacterized protein n=1 Tax=Cafeteria roenbergensis TaxID=33653 RepID=A0A5A8CKL9_CAFRO|nr:hypothetical protein FNF29_03827 [Cafeteria roenbergensis]KAA0161708.1 hypothetical protein FNF31_03651 [Cafeteria roenbergensis]KAA0165215.1 hypothetical protein FNF28_03496 [Cafeteria roenbergensis]KAA0174761.1 hypothetical protein FNF27_03884 [Cafeteria roenbergensis]|eukprot:KAA0152600.1 hypothetical protein FNF29_03827 [Cafeteria roenbergensis]